LNIIKNPNWSLLNKIWEQSENVLSALRTAEFMTFSWSHFIVHLCVLVF
jgi:hypothetical protein